MTNKLIINGGLRYKRGSAILVLYSAPLVRILMHRKIREIHVEYNAKKFSVFQGKGFRVYIERRTTTPIAIISVTKIIPEKLRNLIKNSNKQLPVKVSILDLATKEQLVGYHKAIKYTLPKNNVKLKDKKIIEVACHIYSFYPGCYQIRFRHGIIAAIARKHKLRVDRDLSGSFILRNDPNGTKPNIYVRPRGRGAPVVYFSIPPALMHEDEIQLFRNKRRAISGRIQIPIEEFGLDETQLFTEREEKELAKALAARRIEIAPPRVHEREGDIVITKPRALIKITRISPVAKNLHNNAHGEGIHINARICEGYLYVRKGLAAHSFVVIDEKWSTYGWVQKLSCLVAPEVSIIFTTFRNNWASEIAKTIHSRIGLIK